MAQLNLFTHKKTIVGNMIDPTIETDDRPNYSYINSQKDELNKLKELKKNGIEIKYYVHFVEAGGKTYNIAPDLVRSL